MISMLLINIIYPKIVYGERETDRPPFVGPITGRKPALVIAMDTEAFLK